MQRHRAALLLALPLTLSTPLAGCSKNAAKPVVEWAGGLRQQVTDLQSDAEYRRTLLAALRERRASQEQRMDGTHTVPAEFATSGEVLDATSKAVEEAARKAAATLASMPDAGAKMTPAQAAETQAAIQASITALKEQVAGVDAQLKQVDQLMAAVDQGIQAALNARAETDLKEARERAEVERRASLERQEQERLAAQEADQRAQREREEEGERTRLINRDPNAHEHKAANSDHGGKGHVE